MTLIMTKANFYRYCRVLHGWLSAFAFVALCFLAVTGLLLNHPEWVPGSPASIDTHSFTLSEAEIAQLQAAKPRAPLLVESAKQRFQLKGALNEEEAEGDAVGSELFVRLQGIRGTSFLRADLTTGKVEVTIESASKLTMLNELHRGERAGKLWRLALDVLAVVVILLSLVGFVIFISLNNSRIRIAVLLTLSSSVGLYLLFVYAVS